MESITRLPEKKIGLFLEKDPKLVERLIALKFNEVLGFSSKVTGEFLSKVIERKFEKDIPGMISFLENLPDEKRVMIKSLDFSCEEDHDFTDDQVEQVIALCPDLTSFTLSLSRTTGRWLTQVSKESKLEELSLFYCTDLNEEFLIEFFTARAAHLRSVDLSYTNTTGEGLAYLPENNQLRELFLDRCYYLNERFLEGFFSLKANQLKKIVLDKTEITGEGLSYISEQNQLENLSLAHCTDLNENLLEIFFSKAAHLKIVNLSQTYTSLKGLSQIPVESQLRELVLSSCAFIKEHYLIEFFSLKASHLRKLNLASTKTTGEGLACIPEKNKLEEISLRACNKLDETFIRRFFPLKASHLRSVDLSYTNATGEGLSQLPENNQLRELFLSSCMLLRESCLLDFFSLKAPQLRKIDLSYTNITGKGFVTIPKENQLETLLLRSCEKLDEYFLGRLLASKAAYLKEIDLSFTNITGRGFVTIPKENQLETLLLRSCEKLDEYFLGRLLASKVAYLKEIDLSHTKIIGKGLVAIPKENQLETLLLSSCEKLNEYFLGRFFSSKAAYLKDVDLSFTNTTGAFLTHILPGNQLKYLELNGCQNLNRQFLARIKEQEVELAL
jgi:hypothetical protein